MGQVYLLFYQSILLVFKTVNLLLQRDSPYIHYLHNAMEDLERKLLGRFIILLEIDQAQSVTHVDFQNPSNHLAKSNLVSVQSRYFEGWRMK